MRFFVVFAALALAGCVTTPPPRAVAPVGETELRATMAILASDEFEGRMAGTAGEAKTIAFIADRFARAGLASGARGPTPYLDPFPIAARPAPRPVSPSPSEGMDMVPPAQIGFEAEANRLAPTNSHNVVGVARGRRPDGKAVLLMAHWDHLGICAPKAADKICNGAADNASGVAAMIAIAERVAAMGLDRDVWFVATGAEEWGLLGARAFAARPPLPLGAIVAGFNLDMIALAPAGARVTMIAPPHSRIEPLVRDSVAALGRRWDGDHEADTFLRRQDGWALAEQKVPMIMVGGAFSDMEGLGRFLRGAYHGPDDELRADTELGGAVEDTNLHLEMIRRAASRHYSPGPPKVPELGR